MKTYKEEELIAKVQQGDQQAWKEIVKRYYNPLYIYILGMVKIEDLAEELVQDIFVNFWQKRESIQITSSLKAYLYRSSRNHTLNHLKRRKFEMEYQKKLAQTSINFHNDTEDKYNYSELSKKLHEAIEALPAQCQEIFKLSRFEELTYKEIAESLNIPVRRVHYQIGIALKELKIKLKGLLNDDYIPIILFFIICNFIKNY
ncbi:MAG: RNA polymerase sigma-70 factor [Flammeovirgaceae bacterium]|nr:RNA polymerase sigma-70 factor [Flammeovirgaceae bacterium]